MPAVDGVNNGMVFVGIDPGASGGLAVLGGWRPSQATSMPATMRDVWDWIEAKAKHRPRECAVTAVIERNTGYVGDGGNPGSGMFKFGRNSGALEMALVAAGIPHEDVTPGVWQRALGIAPRKRTESKTAFKNRLKAKAQQLFPAEKVTLATADALLIALYCKRKHEGTL